MLEFVEQPMTSAIDLLTPLEAIEALGDAILGAASKNELLQKDAVRHGEILIHHKEIDALFASLRQRLHESAMAGQLIVYSRPLASHIVYRVPIDYWRGFDALDGGFCERLFFRGKPALDRQWHDAPIFYSRADIHLLAVDVAGRSEPCGTDFFPAARGDARSATRPPLSTAERRQTDELFAEQIRARMATACAKRSCAIWLQLDVYGLGKSYYPTKREAFKIARSKWADDIDWIDFSTLFESLRKHRYWMTRTEPPWQSQIELSPANGS